VVVAVHGCTFTHFGTSRASWCMELTALRRGMLGECGADVEDAERRFHVSATSLEALSASNDVAETWKCFSATSTSATWAWGLW
jgi:hypothetical protein